jgi:hypothetical protein
VLDKEAGGSIGGLDHGCSRRLIGQIATHLSCEPADRFLPEWQTPKERRKSPAEEERFANPWSPMRGIRFFETAPFDLSGPFPFHKGDRGFESVFLQRGVYCELDFRGAYYLGGACPPFWRSPSAVSSGAGGEKAGGFTLACVCLGM